MRCPFAALFAALSLLFMTGCSPPTTVHRANPDGMSDSLDLDAGTPVHLHYAGVYQTSASIDLTQNGVLPGQLSSLLGAFSKLHDSPGQALIDVVIASDIPDVSQAVKALPGWVLILVRDLLNETIQNLLYANNPNIDKVAEIAQEITEIIRSSLVKTQLTVHSPDPRGAIRVDQQVTAMVFQRAGRSIDVQVPSSAAAVMTQMAGRLEARGTAAADASISFSGGTISLPVGDFVLASLGPLLFQPLSGQQTFRNTLTTIIDCQSVGDAVSQGVLGTVGRDLLVSICEFGLTAVAAAIEDQFHRLVFDAVQIENASAMLYDISPSHLTVDHQSDRIADGTWTWSIGASAIPSTFSGARVGDAD